MKFFIVDAFTDVLFGGNPAGVVYLAESGFPSEEVMQKTAAELRYSETAFVQKTGENKFKTRYFTPEAEVDLCGHATIGSFFALAGKQLLGLGVCTNETLAGNLDIVVSEDSVLMDMAAPQAIQKMDSDTALKELYKIMGLDFEKEHIQYKNKELYPEMISTGLPDIMMPVADEAVLSAIAPDFPALSELSKRYEVVGVHAFALNSKDGNVHCRNFAPLYDIDEEAATGTSNGALTYYLYKNGIIQDGAETLFVQGEAMQRPSKIMSSIKTQGDHVQVQVGGKAVLLAEGEIYL